MRALLSGLRIAIIREGPLRGAELVLERNQAFVAAVGAPEIKACRARGLAFLDELPEKKRHASELVKGSVRASVFVNDVGAVRPTSYASCSFSARRIFRWMESLCRRLKSCSAVGERSSS